METLAAASDKPLFTPGPLTTSRTVKQAMLRDLGSRDFEFIRVVREIRSRLLALGGVGGGNYEAIPMQGSGTFVVESVLSATAPPDGKVLILENGAYGKRIQRICKVLKINTEVLSWPEDQTPEPDRVGEVLDKGEDITHIAIVHCETTTGILNPVKEVGKVVRSFRRILFVDAMSSFGAVPINLSEWNIDYLVSSANKCIEGVPGFGFVLARREPFLKTKGWARSLSLDLFDQWEALEKNGQFRFTPPTHALLAFHQALLELEEEGGIESRAERYRNNQRVLVEGMRKMGFKEYLVPDRQGWIITTFLYPDNPRFDFEDFYRRLNDRGFVIYPGKLTQADCFRIGSIGRIFEADMRALLAAIRETLLEMGIEPRVSGP